VVTCSIVVQVQHCLLSEKDLDHDVSFPRHHVCVRKAAFSPRSNKRIIH
jgi:hypothetical protein